MEKLNIKRSIEVPAYTADDWQLFTFEVDAKTLERSNLAATRLNQALAEAVNAGWDRDTVFSYVEQVMIQFSDTGASDSEPYHMLEDLLDQVFGEE